MRKAVRLWTAGIPPKMKLRDFNVKPTAPRLSCGYPDASISRGRTITHSASRQMLARRLACFTLVENPAGRPNQRGRDPPRQNGSLGHLLRLRALGAASDWLPGKP